MRQVVLDTETTGLNPKVDRICEIAIVEIVDRKITGKHFHSYVNPRMTVEEEAFRIHGLSNEFLEDKPEFIDIVEPIFDFVGDSEVIIHNASFDTGMLRREFLLADDIFGVQGSTLEQFQKWKITDTLVLARKQFKRGNSLDALAKKLDVANKRQEFHEALVDTQMLAEIYLKLTEGQIALDVTPAVEKIVETDVRIARRKIPVIFPSEAELKTHEAFVKNHDVRFTF
jgi:DNA polymerase-3 subunit epsilon